MLQMNPLLDTDFLEQLTAENEREIYARITALDISENPIEFLEGKITDGSIEIDGKSILRRTCNLTLTAQDVNINEVYWGLRSKIILEVGLKNKINSNYPDIIWFKQGLFIITQFDASQDVNKWSIKISGKDKMCLLNGELSGELLHDTDFGKEQYHDKETDTISYTEIPIKNIIRNIVQEFGRELPQNIIINDIDDAGLELLEYKNTEPAYLYRGVEDNEYKNIIIDSELSCFYKLKKILSLKEYLAVAAKYNFLLNYYEYNDIDNSYILNEEDIYFEQNQYFQDKYWFKGKISDDFFITYDDLFNTSDSLLNIQPTNIRFSGGQSNEYYVAKIQTGDTPGYYLTELTYPGELIGKTGETLTSVLDKIKSMLSNFEYYYDVNGKFVFQKKSDYVISTWNSQDYSDRTLYTDASINNSSYMYSFLDSTLVSSFSNTPKLQNIKNDFSVWGTDKSSGTEIPIHMRYAIDHKPIEYKPIRPLKEEIITVLYDKNGNEVNTSIVYKYYDAPEIQPYNEEYLYKLTDPNIYYNGFSVTEITVPTDDYIQKITIYPYFAMQSYKVADTIEIQYNPLEVLLQFEGMTEGKLKNLQDDYEAQKELDYGFANKYDYFEAILPPEWYNALAVQKVTIPGLDWRELIYQMALDYRKCHNDDNFLYYIAQANPIYFPTGRTGYEQYYIDLEGFWRTLYNPNPEMRYKPLNYNDVIDYDKSSIFIEHGYRNITYEEFTHPNLTASELYKFSQPLNGENILLYPFIGSDECYLDFNYNYYFYNDGNMLLKNATNQKSQDYIDLNSSSLNNIYIKNLQEFAVKIDDIEERETYITVNEESLDAVSNTYDVFKVPYYPSVSRLNTYNDMEGEDYLKFIDVCFDEIKNHPMENILSEYYIKDLKYVSLNEYYKEDKFWNQLYSSNFISFQYLARDLIATLDSLQLSDFEIKDKSLYLINYIDAIKNYIIKMNSYRNAKELQDQLNNELKLIVKYNFELISSGLNNYINSFNLNEENSCLPFLFLNYITDAMTRVYNENDKDLDSLTRTEHIKTLYLLLQNTIKDIDDNYNQVDFVLNLESDLEALITIEEIRDTLLQYKNDLNKVINIIENGQYDKTLSQIETLIVNIDNGQITIDNLNEMKNFIHYEIILPIQLLKTFNESIDTLIENLIKNSYEDFFTLLNKIKNLVQLLELKECKMSEIYPLITFERNNLGNNFEVVFLPELYQKLTQTWTNQQFTEAFNSYIDSTYGFQEHFITEDINNFNYLISDKLKYEKINYYYGYYDYNHSNDNNNFWLLDVLNRPQSLVFWFDFLPVEGAELDKISVPSIGSRTKSINDTNVRAIHYKDIPSVIFKKTSDKNFERKSGYSYIFVNNNTETYFSISSKGKSAKEVIDELLYTHTNGAQSIKLSVVPVYHLEPNHHIFVRDDRSHINGEYIVERISLPLSFKKTMNITAIKAISDIV